MRRLQLSNRRKWFALLLGSATLLGCSTDDQTPDHGAGGAASQEGPVEFANVRVEDITSTRAVVRFDTSQPTSCEAQFGIHSDALDQTAVDPDMEEGELSLDHSVPLEDLHPATTYFWRARAETGSGEVFYSEVFSFQTESGNDGALLNVASKAEGTTILAVSSNFGGGDNDSSWGAENAIDGMMATEWSTAGDGNNASITLDFGQERFLSGFGFRSREMTDGSSIVRSVELSFDDGSATLGPFSTPDPTVFYEFEFDTPVRASTVTLDAVETTGGNTGAREIQFFVEPDND